MTTLITTVAVITVYVIGFYIIGVPMAKTGLMVYKKFYAALDAAKIKKENVSIGWLAILLFPWAVLSDEISDDRDGSMAMDFFGVFHPKGEEKRKDNEMRYIALSAVSWPLRITYNCLALITAVMVALIAIICYSVIFMFIWIGKKGVVSAEYLRAEIIDLAGKGLRVISEVARKTI